MKQERNKNIILELQIAQTKQRIMIGEDTYPIDIVETVGKKEKQIYYALPNSVSQTDQAPETNWYDILPTPLSEWEIERASKRNNLAIMSIQKNRTTPDKKVYLVDYMSANTHTDSVLSYSNCSDKKFIAEAKRQKLVFSLEEYQSEINLGHINMSQIYIRFI